MDVETPLKISPEEDKLFDKNKQKGDIKSQTQTSGQRTEKQKITTPYMTKYEKSKNIGY